ncbi:MAG: hypothetical protein K6F98_08585 [Bacteroidales bacterium]|nr:hypothetical protein [Bacteroidales bacterium]
MSDAGGPPLTIEHLTGLALGRLGMSFDDFCRCTPGEFRAGIEGASDAAEQLAQHLKIIGEKSSRIVK